MSTFDLWIDLFWNIPYSTRKLLAVYTGVFGLLTYMPHDAMITAQLGKMINLIHNFYNIFHY